MALSPDYYSVLGVPSTASRETIHAAWKALLRQYHPDANHG
ncbi:DnaJ domain-containing protein, partial [Sphingomonas sp. Leaf30]